MMAGKAKKLKDYCLFIISQGINYGRVVFAEHIGDKVFDMPCFANWCLAMVFLLPNNQNNQTWYLNLKKRNRKGTG